MRIVIDIDGDQVRVHRVVGDEPPPPDLVAKAAAIGAESAGIARVPGGVAVVTALGVEPADGGRAPAAARGGRKAPPSKRAAARRPAPKARLKRRSRR